MEMWSNESEDKCSKAVFSLPLKPEEPLPSDCCGSGCTPCVFDIYEEDVRKWERKCKEITSGAASYSSDSCEIISRSEFKEFELESMKKVAEKCWVYRFMIPGGKRLGLNVGEHLILRSDMDDPPITRQYTPISPLDACGYFDVLIKIYEDGKMSKYVETWQVGDKVKWKGPFGKFIYTPNRYHHICMLAAGTGIAPMIQVLQSILDNDDDETRISLLYTCRTYQEILMKDVLDVSTDHWNFNVMYVISREDKPGNETRVRYGDRIHYGRIDKDLLSHEIPAPSNKVFVLICGTKSFDKDMINFLSQLGYDGSTYFRF
ncbi:NADH-cytochrome b5 reductase-like [Actinia tenebrosa]|uniref:NADH-cytochrome b5 reductase n=1 Tax=Actinia tenebrosa TaxID=6105 RepID=A0A6P8HQQ3_ACTTE|nr:NADH-cytochrome b5 reductase-like [Actinia tenebrosa]